MPAGHIAREASGGYRGTIRLFELKGHACAGLTAGLRTAASVLITAALQLKI